MAIDLGNFPITHKTLKLVDNISRFEERFANLPIEREWMDEIKEGVIEGEVFAGFILDGEDVGSFLEKGSVEKIKSPVMRQRALNEIELRNSFPLYFKEDHLSIEQLHYLHRFLANTSAEEASSRGKFRKVQDFPELQFFTAHGQKAVRYGFLSRSIDEFLEEFNTSGLHILVLAGIINAELVRLLPYSYANFQLARVVSKGFLYTRKFDQNNLLAVSDFKARKPKSYYRAMNKYIKGNPTEWIDLFLRSIVEAYKNLSKEIEDISGGTVRPLENEVVALTDRQKVVVKLLQKNGQMAGSEVATILGVTRQNIHVIMQKLLRKKVVERVGKGSTARYKLRGKKY